MPALPGPASTVAPTSQPIGFDSTRGPLSGPRGWDSSTLGHPDVDAALHRSFLGTLPADVVERVMADRDLVDYPAGTTFYREGDPPRATLVVTGLIRVYLPSSEGQ